MCHRKGSTERLLAAEDYLHREEQLEESLNEKVAAECNREKLSSSWLKLMQEVVEKQKVIDKWEKETDSLRALVKHAGITETSISIVEVDNTIEGLSVKRADESPDFLGEKDDKKEEKTDDHTSHISFKCPQHSLKALPKVNATKKGKKSESTSVKYGKIKSHVSYDKSSLAGEDPRMRRRRKLIVCTASTVTSTSTTHLTTTCTSPSFPFKSLEESNKHDMLDKSISSSPFSSSEAIPLVPHLQSSNFSPNTDDNHDTVAFSLQNSSNDGTIARALKAVDEENFDKYRKNKLKAGMLNNSVTNISYDYEEVKKAIYTEAKLKNMEKMEKVRENVMRKITSLSNDYNLRTESLLQRAEEREMRVTQSIMEDMKKDKKSISIEENIDSHLDIDDEYSTKLDCIEDVVSIDSSKKNDGLGPSSPSTRYSSEPRTVSLLMDASPSPSGTATYIPTWRSSPSTSHTNK